MKDARPFPGLDTPETVGQAGREFIDRDPQYPATREQTNYAGEGKLADMQSSTPLGEPPVDVDIRSVYDVRPIQAFDFNTTVIATSGGGSASSFGILTTQFTVPLGYVAVVRKWHTSFTSPQPPITYRGQVLMTIRSNNADLPNNVDIPVGLESDFVESFFIVDEGGLIGARFDIANPGTPSVAAFDVNCHIYGNLIRKTGRAANLEIGNPVKIQPPVTPDDQPVTWLKRMAAAMGVKT